MWISFIRWLASLWASPEPSRDPERRFAIVCHACRRTLIVKTTIIEGNAWCGYCPACAARVSFKIVDGRQNHTLLGPEAYSPGPQWRLF